VIYRMGRSVELPFAGANPGENDDLAIAGVAAEVLVTMARTLR
jgi:hypothetical protein